MSPASALSTEVAAWLADPGFTPGSRHFGTLFATLADAEREFARKLERVIARGGLDAGHFALTLVGNANSRFRARLLAVIGRVATESSTSEFNEVLARGLEDPDERVRRVSTLALAKLNFPGLEEPLLTRFAQASDLERRSLAEALGKSGAHRALEFLSTVRTGDPELKRIVERACLMLARDRGRSEASEIALTRPLGEAHLVVLHCRAGLSSILADEARGLAPPQVAANDQVTLSYDGSFGDLLALRTATDFGLRMPLLGGARTPVEDRLAETLAMPKLKRAVRAWTDGPARFRLAFAAGGHQRKKTWQAAAVAAARLPWFLNDPKASTWQITVDEARAQLELSPRRFDDPRFAYRARDVPAASHPTLAAALARVAGVRADDVVWDPFVGSGLELIERARLGPCRELHGTDLDARALDAARENADRAQVTLNLSQADATRHRIVGVSLILTNPPMGRRVARDGSVGALLDAFVRHAATVLQHGRLIWLSPLPERTAAEARRVGFRVTRVSRVDLGGFDAELQRFER